MSSEPAIRPEDIEKFYSKLLAEAESSGYHLNPDADFTKELLRGLIVNELRYGYQACPCRLASGIKEEDIDIICPCDYRDADLTEYGACYCGLYVSQAVFKGKIKASPIPERREPKEKRRHWKSSFAPAKAAGNLPLPVWRCKVCGYLCAREQPPDVCPICKAKSERFERFM